MVCLKAGSLHEYYSGNAPSSVGKHPMGPPARGITVAKRCGQVMGNKM